MVFLLFSHPQEEAGLDCRVPEMVLRTPLMSLRQNRLGLLATYLPMKSESAYLQESKLTQIFRT